MERNHSKIEQLKNAILADIRAGVYRSGAPLPSVRQLSENFGVSKHTVSQALSNLHELKVLEVAHGKATRVRENPFRRRIELFYCGLIPLAYEEFWSEIYLGIQEGLALHPDYSYNITSGTTRDFGGFIRGFDPAEVCGMLVLGTPAGDTVEALGRFGLPLVEIYGSPLAEKYAVVTVDVKGPVEEMMALLKARGRRRVAYFQRRDPMRRPRFADNMNDFKWHLITDSLFKNGLTPGGSFFREVADKHDGYALLKEMAESGELPDAIVLSSDAQALGIYRAAHELGLRLPDDLDIVSFDNLESGRYLIPSITTVDIRRRELGRLGVERLLEAVETGKPPRSEILPAKLVIRESLN